MTRMTHAKVEREALSIGKVVFESLLLVVSVVLGFAVSEWGTHAKERELAERVRKSVAAEVGENLKTIQAQIERHTVAIAALKRARPDSGAGAIMVMSKNLPNGSIGAVPMRRAAWDAAVSSGALRLLAPDLVERYSDIYVRQERVYDDDTTWLKTVLYRPENFEPERQKAALQTLTAMLEELKGNEEYMRDLYRAQLPALQKAAG